MKRLHGILVAAIVVMLAGALALGAAACGDDKDKDEDATPTSAAAEPTEEQVSVEPGTLPITTLEYRFEAPETISGGLTAITLDNPGGEDHQAQLLKLNEGVTMEQLSDALSADESGAAALALVTVGGGVNAVPAGGGTSEAIVDLEPGTYAMLCFVSNAEGVPHFALGMLSELEVTEPTEEADTPAGDHAITATDYAFSAPTTAVAGETTVQFVNSGTEAHELSVVKLEDGTTAEDLLGLFTAPEEPTPAEGEPTPTTPADQAPPFTAVGGIGAIPPGPGSDAWWIQDLEAGTYGLLCFVPNSEGVPHAALGMIATFTVE
ncbi:MAG: hypothetical protein WEB04_04270 [Dehalococcoidia bacterium]